MCWSNSRPGTESSFALSWPSWYGTVEDCRPVVVMIRPEVMLLTSSPPTMATDISPASVGDMPRESWKYWLR